MRDTRIPLKNRIQWPPTIGQITEAIVYQWNTRGEWSSAKMEWGEMEDLLSYILKASGLTPDQKIGLTMETIDAYTKRGHFAPSDYPESYEDTRGLLP